MESSTLRKRRRLAFLLQSADAKAREEDLALARQILAQSSALPEPVTTGAGAAEEAIADALAEAVLAERGKVPDELRALIAEEPGPAADGVEGLDFAIRSVPFRTSTNPFSVPGLGAGRRVERTLGPFRDAAGRLIFVDIFRRVRQVPLVRGSGTTPILLLPLRGLLLAAATSYQLPAGSIWIRSTLLAADASAGGYSGIRIRGGTLTLSSAPTVAGGTLQIGAGVTATLEIDTDSPSPTSIGNGLGPDADLAGARPPARARFVFTGASASLTAAQDAELKAYGSSATLSHIVAAGRFEPLLNRVLLGFEVAPDAFEMRQVRSELFQPTGAAEVSRGAWALSITIADPSTLGEAANAGAVAVRFEGGLRAEWRGLAGGPARLGSGYLMVEPGRLVLASTLQGGVPSLHRIGLWQEAGTPPGAASQLVLGLRSADAVRFFSEAGAIDALQVDASVEASLDRPVNAAGHRFPLRSEKGFVALWLDGTGARAFVLADVSPRTREARRAMRALALTNALIRLTDPVFLLLTGPLATPNRMDSGVAAVLFGVAAVIPSLRDPYVTNFALPQRDDVRRDNREVATARLLALIVWPAVDRPEMSLLLLPNPTAGAFAAAAVSQPQDREVTTPFGRGTIAATRGLTDGQAVNGLRNIFRETAGSFDPLLLLVDVSSNIDQFGVGWGFFRRDDHFGRVNVGSEFPLRIDGLDLSAPTRNLRVVLLPQFQWEPVTNIPNPNVPGVFPTLLSSADDGGRTELGTNSVTLVPIAPDRLARQILKEFNRPTNTPIGALFTLPFGMKAAARLHPDTSLVAKWATVSFNIPETADGRLTGGLQIAAQSHPDLGPGVESPSFPGAAWQLQNGLDAATNTPLGLSVLSAAVGNPGVEEFFNNEMGPGGSNQRVPLTRIDFSGYGASTFSRWSNPNAIVAQVSHTRFDVFVGRTAYEVVQIVSILLPWAVPVVRTITLERRKEGIVTRFDSGWVASGPGVYRYPVPTSIPAGWTPIETHPGVVRGAFNVRRIRETGRVVARPAFGVELLEVRFDADFEIDGLVTPRSAEGRVASRDQVGFVQRTPSGFPLFPEHLAAILEDEGPVGGAIDCVVDIGLSGQRLQVARVDVAPAPPAIGGIPQFAAAVRGALALPRDGEWSAFRHDRATGELAPVDAHAGVPLVRAGTASGIVGTSPFYRIAEPADLLRESDPAVQFGLVQGSEGHRALFPRPRIQAGQTRWSSTELPALADTYTLSIGAGAFPSPDDCFLGLAAWVLDIRGDGRFKLAPPTIDFTAPPGVGDRLLVDSAVFKIRTRYTSNFKFRLDPDDATPWAVETTPTAIFTTMDLGPFTELLGIRHGFRVASNAAPTFSEPETVYPPPLDPIIEVLEFLAELLGGGNALDVSGFKGSQKFKASLNLLIVNPNVSDKYFDLGLLKVKGKLSIGVSSAPVWSGFINLELGAKVPVLPPIFGGGEIGFGLEGSSVTEQKVTITMKWSASFGVSLGPISVDGSFYFGIQVIFSTSGFWQIGILVGISASANIWIAKITVKIELLAAIAILPPALAPPDGAKEALGRAKFAAEIEICWFLSISVEYTLEYKERVNI